MSLAENQKLSRKSEIIERLNTTLFVFGLFIGFVQQENYRNPAAFSDSKVVCLDQEPNTESGLCLRHYVFGLSVHRSVHCEAVFLVNSYIDLSIIDTNTIAYSCNTYLRLG